MITKCVIFKTFLIIGLKSRIKIYTGIIHEIIIMTVCVETLRLELEESDKGDNLIR